MTKTIVPLLLISAVALSGCGKKKEDKPSEASAPAQTAASADTGSASASDQAKQAAEAVAAQAKAAAEQAKQQAEAAARQAAEQAKEAAAQAQQQATAAATQATDALKAEISAASAKAVESAKTLLDTPQVTDSVKTELNKLISGVTSGNDAESTSALARIVALKPSDEQMTLVKEVQSNVGVLVLGRNFDANDPASGGAVKQAIDAIKAKDTAAVVTNLKTVASNASLTDSQKQVVTNLLGSYSGKLAGAVDTVNKASQALKGFGL